MFSKPYSGVKYFGVWAEETADTFGKRDALAVLQDVLDRCRDEDMRCELTMAALDYLAARSSKPWRFQTFRQALDMLDPESRWQNVNASLNGVRSALKG